MFHSDQFLGFSLAAATGNDPLAAGNIAATLVTNYNWFWSYSDQDWLLCRKNLNLKQSLLPPIQLSLVVTVLVSKMSPDEETGWRVTQMIINPLTPWIATFEKELKVVEISSTLLQVCLAGERGASVALVASHGGDHCHVQELGLGRGRLYRRLLRCHLPWSPSRHDLGKTFPLWWHQTHWY